MSSDDRISCKVSGCEFKSHSLATHVLESHGLSKDEYLQVYGGTIMSPKVMKNFTSSTSKMERVAAPAPVDLTVDLMGMKVKVDAAVEADRCLPLPDGYQFPSLGKAHEAYLRVLQALIRGRNCFVWGMPGTGKDAVVHAFSAYTRRPVVMVTFRPGTDLAPWFYTRSIDENGTGWEYGHLWRALTEGVEGRDGQRRAALVLLSDVDRADSAQAEWFRILTDSISGRILDPSGKMVTLFPGTQFVCTANSCGTGDARGRMASANPMDASILDRLGRKIEAAYMNWDDESKILKAKFPKVVEKAPELFSQLGNSTRALRSSIEKEELLAEFTHRSLCDVLAECEDIIHFDPTTKNLLKNGFRAWMQGLDKDSRLTAERLTDPHLKGGAI